VLHNACLFIFSIALSKMLTVCHLLSEYQLNIFSFCVCFRGKPPLDPELKLAITLRFLATGNSYQSLAFSFRVVHNTISVFVPQVCAAVVDEYRDEVFRTPSNPAEWRKVADLYGRRWNLPHCCGALEGKHIALKQPRRTGTLYYNYKGFFSIVLLALVDADYKFLWAEVGANGASSDWSIQPVGTGTCP
jgi:hypothetical protein